TVKNTGTAELANCVVTDTNFTDAGCPASGTPSGASSAVAVSPSTIASLGAGATAPAVTGTIAGLTQNSCNTTAVTCEIVGSVDPANPSARKKLTATAQDTCETCSVKADKQIKCGAGPFIDVGFESNNEDGTASCLGWNAFTVNGTSVAAEALTVQYVAQNTGGTALFGCTVTDSNTAISSTTVPIADTIAVGGTSSPVPVNKTCSDTLDASEPDTATLSCFCTADKNPNFVATATDSASFDCQTPGLVVTKDCAIRDTNGNSAVTITVTNAGTADLENCTVTDTNFTDAACPASGSPTGTSAGVAVSPSTIASLTAGSMTTATGTATGLTKDSCNTVSVTCEIKGSVDPNNPGHQKTLTATAQDTCETCSVQIDKQIKCGAGPFIDVGFVGNNEDGTASCLGWNAFTIDGANVPAESLTVQYTAKNTGGTALFSCTVTDTNTVISSTTVPIADTIVVSGTSNPVPINTTCSAELSASEPDTATVSCFCTADKNANFLATAKDMAKFQCLTPGLNVTKTCLVPDASGNSEVDIELMNTGTADLANCVVSDNVFKNDPTCPPTGASTPVTVPGVASLPHGMSTTVKASVSGLTTNACNTASVTCEVVGSVDPANPSQQKKITATDSAVCEVPSVKIEKVCVAQDANGVNQMTFKVTNTGGVALANCAITDNIFTNDPTCPPTGAGTAVATTPASIAALDPGAMASAMGSVSGLTADACDDVVVTCDVVGASGQTVTSKDEKVCTVPVCPTTCANPRIGAGSQPPIWTVLQLDGGKVDITGPAGGIDGDICIADSGKLSITGSEFVTGNIRLSAGATFSKSGSGTVGGVLQTQNLSQQVTDALAAAAAATALPCTQTIGNLSSVQTIVGNGGLNVICVTNVTLSGGKKVFLMGGASDQFVVNVTGNWALSGGSQIRVAGGVQPNAVLYNIIGTGGQVAFSGGGGGTGCCKAIVDGTLLAPNRKIALSPGLVNGQVISGLDISIVSGSC